MAGAKNGLQLGRRAPPEHVVSYIARARRIRLRITDRALAAHLRLPYRQVKNWFKGYSDRRSHNWHPKSRFSPWQVSRLRRAKLLRASLSPKAVSRRLGLTCSQAVYWARRAHDLPLREQSCDRSI